MRNLRTKIEEGIEEPYKLKLKQIGEEFLIKATLINSLEDTNEKK